MNPKSAKLETYFSLVVASVAALDRFTNYQRLVFAVIPNLVEKYGDVIDDTIYADTR